MSWMLGLAQRLLSSIVSKSLGIVGSVVVGRCGKRAQRT